MLAASVPKFILGSGSPRRKVLLQAAGFLFDVVTAEIDETIKRSGLSPQEVVDILATKKLATYTQWLNKKIVLTADTLVFKEDKILGKPENRSQAIEMLEMLSNDSHQVTTSVCLGFKEHRQQFRVTTKVFFAKLDLAQIIYYVDHNKPYDKAGSYGIQEWIGQVGIKHIEGSYTNVMGLPMYETYNALIAVCEDWLN